MKLISRASCGHELQDGHDIVYVNPGENKVNEKFIALKIVKDRVAAGTYVVRR